MLLVLASVSVLVLVVVMAFGAVLRQANFAYDGWKWLRQVGTYCTLWRSWAVPDDETCL